MDSIAWIDAGAAWHKRRVPYEPSSTYLHTLDLWIPKAVNDASAHAIAPPPASDVPNRVGKWIIYIHGGAWRDPLVDSSSFEATALQLLSAAEKDAAMIAGIASINYPLSSHPNHPTHPSPPQDSSQPVDSARIAKHPDHILSVLSALAYLQGNLHVAHDYLLTGHSCGATLAFQVAMDSQRWSISSGGQSIAPAAISKPAIIVGLNGLYDLPYFIRQPDRSHAALGSVYSDFTSGAFGTNKEVWQQVCPTVVEDWEKEWPEGKLIVLVQSKEDTLVPYSQMELMKRRLAETSKVKVLELEADGDHNDLWKNGDKLAEILLQAAPGA